MHDALFHPKDITMINRLDRFSIIALLLASTSIMPAHAYNEYANRQEQSVAVNTQAQWSRVVDVRRMPDNRWVVMRGRMQRHIDGNRYLFRDNTGSITVTIDNNRWRNSNARFNDYIEVSGKVDREGNIRTVNVQKIVRLNR
jgi:uncharacterized protein (TIGR00156 family)